MEKNGTFTFMHTNITHYPFALNAMCELRNDEYPDPTATSTELNSLPVQAPNEEMLRILHFIVL